MNIETKYQDALAKCQALRLELEAMGQDTACYFLALAETEIQNAKGEIAPQRGSAALKEAAIDHSCMDEARFDSPRAAQTS